MVTRAKMLYLLFSWTILPWSILAVAVNSACAHEIRPAVVTITLGPVNDYRITATINIEALLAGIGSEHKDTDEAPEAQTYNALRSLPPEALKLRFRDYGPRWLAGILLELDGVRAAPKVDDVTVPPVGDVTLARISTVQLTGTMAAPVGVLNWSYARELGSCVVRIKPDGRPAIEAGWLKDGGSTGPVAIAEPVSKTKLQQFASYLRLGFVHIVPLGLDHILFVVGLYLLSPHWRPLLAQVTAFTVAHSITLALGLYGVLAVSPRIVEPLIALSIAYVAIENIVTGKLQPWRPFVVFGFGLLHGLGFAGILQDVGLPRSNYAMGLFGFNVGVELAQLFVILVAWLMSGLWFGQRSWYRQRVVWPASAIIAAIGVFWTVERIWFA
jgi:HupE / UreJ protein